MDGDGDGDGDDEEGNTKEQPPHLNTYMPAFRINHDHVVSQESRTNSHTQMQDIQAHKVRGQMPQVPQSARYDDILHGSQLKMDLKSETRQNATLRRAVFVLNVG